MKTRQFFPVVLLVLAVLAVLGPDLTACLMDEGPPVVSGGPSLGGDAASPGTTEAWLDGSGIEGLSQPLPLLEDPLWLPVSPLPDVRNSPGPSRGRDLMPVRELPDDSAERIG